MTRNPLPGARWFIVLLLLGCLGATPGSWAAAEDSLAELERRFEVAQKEKGPQKAYEVLKPDFEDFARSRSGSEDGLGAELWLLRMHWWKRAEGTMQKEAGPFAKRLVREYADSPQLKRVPEFSYLFSDADFEELCTQLLEGSPHAEVRAECLYAQGRKVKRRDPAAAERFFRSLRDDYADVPFRAITYGEIAEAHLAPHPSDQLKIGSVAPEIVGTDVNGEPMKLSDYRGKVVVLDFWGDW